MDTYSASSGIRLELDGEAELTASLLALRLLPSVAVPVAPLEALILHQPGSCSLSSLETWGRIEAPLRCSWEFPPKRPTCTESTHHPSGRSIGRTGSRSLHPVSGTPTAEGAPTGMPAARATGARAAAAVRTRYSNPNSPGRCQRTLSLCSTRDSCLHRGCGSNCMAHSVAPTWDHAVHVSI